MYEKISDSIYFIHGKAFDSNSILVISDIIFIVDTGTGEHINELKSDIKEIGHQPEAIVNTHCHFDHVGGNHFFDAQSSSMKMTYPIYLLQMSTSQAASSTKN